MRPVGHITDLINELSRWSINRVRKDMDAVQLGKKRLSVEPLQRAIEYLTDYRYMCAVPYKKPEQKDQSTEIRFYMDERGVKDLLNQNADLKRNWEKAKLELATKYSVWEVRAALGVPLDAPTDEELLDTDFEKRGRCHDWRNYVDRHNWLNMSALERIIDYAHGIKEANSEVWD